MLAHSFLIESSSKLLVTRTGIKTSMSSISSWIRPLILEFLALEWWKFHTCKLEYLWSQLASLDQILCVASLGWGKGCIRFWGRLDQNPSFHGNRKPPLTYNGENDVATFSRLFLIRSFLAHLNKVHGELLYYPRRWRWCRRPQMLKFYVKVFRTLLCPYLFTFEPHLENLFIATWEQQRCSSASAFVQSDQCPHFFRLVSIISIGAITKIPSL